MERVDVPSLFTDVNRIAGRCGRSLAWSETGEDDKLQAAGRIKELCLPDICSQPLTSAMHLVALPVSEVTEVTCCPRLPNINRRK